MDIVWLNQLSFQRTDDQGVAIGEAEIVTKGNPVPDYVRPFIRNALANSGAIVAVADDLTDDQRDRRLAEAAEHPRALPNPEQPPTPDGLPPLLAFDTPGSDLPTTDSGDAASADTGRPSTVADFTPAGDAGNEGEPATGDTPSGQKPSVRDTKAAWEDYAVTWCGMDRGEAESKTKAELIAEVEGRDNA